MLAVVQHPAVDLVCEDDQVVLASHRGNLLDVLSGRDAAGRVRRRVDDYKPRPGSD